MSKPGRSRARAGHKAPLDLLVAFCPECGDVGAAVLLEDHEMIEGTECPHCGATPDEYFYRRSGQLIDRKAWAAERAGPRHARHLSRWGICP